VSKEVKFPRAAYAGGLVTDPKPTKAGGKSLFIGEESIGVGAFKPSHGIVRWDDVARVEITSGMTGGAFGIVSPSGQQRVQIAVERKDGTTALYEVFRVSPAQVRSALALRLMPLGIEVAA